MSKSRVSQREIAKKMRRSLATVNRICQAIAQQGRLHDAPRLTSSRATTPEENLLIVAACVADSFQTAREIRDNLRLNVSERLIKRRLEEAGLYSPISAQKPLLSAHCQLRLSFDEQHRTWSAADWNIVVFSDESTFRTRWDQQHRVWRPTNYQ
ncbi:hypothetical protein HPB49_022235 [Dermacentor silvarum]|uniref:Uncharacterized protein n=1 Tax=Dermacentor silvarum TaxID=543639 RepID=A0ACB8DG55_DERSI|nr:hypothetical protein HPB49_022235 [Dermacentor silvarum]